MTTWKEIHRIQDQELKLVDVDWSGSGRKQTTVTVKGADLENVRVLHAYPVDVYGKKQTCRRIVTR